MSATKGVAGGVGEGGNILPLPTGCCAVQWPLLKGGVLPLATGLTAAWLPIGHASQFVLLLVRQSVTQDNCLISVSYPSSSKVR